MEIYKENITIDFQQFFEEDYNVIIYAGEEPNVKELHAHSIILRCRSQYFRTAFSSNWAEKKDGMYILKKPNITGNIFQIILSYIYSGTINFSQIEQTKYLELLKAADELGFDKIIENLQLYLINHQQDYLKSDPIGILQIVFLFEQLILLKDFCLKLICQETKILFEGVNFLTVPAHTLELLLQQDELALDEIDIWNYLIKWAHAQNPTIERDPLKWTEEDNKIMKETINKLIKLIRFQNFSIEDYINKISPYKKLLPKNLISDILQISNMKSFELDSSIIPVQKDLYPLLFLNWINNEDNIIYKTRNFLQYEFKLILRGSRDGFDGEVFHNKCDNKKETITIVKIKDSNKLIGGYNPLGWDGNDFKNTLNSFIFLFDDYKDINTGKIGRVIEKQCAIRCIQKWGPLFGKINNYSNDIMMTPNGEWSSSPNSYPDINIPRNFKIDDYEVFQILKRKF
ncbi:BTB-domain-containing protein [Rhizophagus irregularis]|uniref:BTB-domain-containing protein n=1 Tax=Rhizophagus irregularis TaxID=588596 RepID=A0A2N1MVM6_9GLOM|nr:BTB-domain-containing protein [Rhizophagus irregularis]